MKSVTENRWWVYQRERFPILAHGPLILAFSACAVCFSSLLRGEENGPSPTALFVAFVSSFISFLHLRLADEFKDFEEDSKFRPYRPVPRGLVHLKELTVWWIVTGLIQLGLALWLNLYLLIPLAFTWIYLALMSHEFFARAWLKARPFTYMWTHMLIMPLVDFYATACDWLPTLGDPPHGLKWFVAASFFNGFVIEIGRKIRAPEDEEKGVETYSILWGRPRAIMGWWLVMVLTGFCAVQASLHTGFTLPLLAVLVLVFVLALVFGFGFTGTPQKGGGKHFELLSGLWTLLLYLLLGVIPMIWRVLS